MMASLTLDHLVICATDLDEGVAAIEPLIGAQLQPGGKHPDLGTHNRLLSLGPDLYMEVIAIDPDAHPPNIRRWFGLDDFHGYPRLAHWVVASTDLQESLSHAPAGAGTPRHLSRGDLHWQMAVPESGQLPMSGMFPGLIEWGQSGSPAPRMPDSGCRLSALHVQHPDVEIMAAALAGLEDVRVHLETGHAMILAELETPNGLIRLPC